VSLAVDQLAVLDVYVLHVLREVHQLNRILGGCVRKRNLTDRMAVDAHRDPARTADEHEVAEAEAVGRGEDVEVARLLSMREPAARHRHAQFLRASGQRHSGREWCGAHLREGGVRLDEESLRFLCVGSRAAGGNRRNGRQ